jgi:hypothetical protein
MIPFFKKLPVWIASAVLIASPVPGQDAPELSFVQTEGPDFVTESGERIRFQGVNLGNWFLLEAWMMGIGDVPDQHTIFQILDRRFGIEKRKELIETHRDTWITEADFARIRDLGMNCVRLPIHYSMLLDLEADGFASPEGFARLDRVLDMARDNGLYVFLDLHGVPGGQSVEQPSGRVNSNQLWGSELNQDLTVLIWELIAKRYKDDPVIAAYDIINEPYGEGTRSPIREELRLLCERIYAAIRAQGDEHVILFPATQMGFFFYRSPAEMGARNLGFTEHFYPGIFHGEQSIDGHAQFVAHELEPRRELLNEWGAPYLVGEFNVVHEHTGGDPVMQAYWDLYESYGWAATMWSYKLIKPAAGVEPVNWYLVTNAEAQTIPDLRTDDYATIAAFFDHSDVRSVADPDAIDAFRGELTTTYQFPQYESPRVDAPEAVLPTGWSLFDVGEPIFSDGSARFAGDGSVELYGIGDDIYGTHDGFTYVYRQLEGDFVFEAEYADFQTAREYAKSGLMVRDSLAAGSAMVLLNVFRDGSVAFAERSASGHEIREVKAQAGSFPIHLKLESENGRLRASWKTEASDWQTIGEASIPYETVGFGTSANHLQQVAAAYVREFQLTQK